MNWPSIEKYSDAILKLSFQDSDLKNSIPETSEIISGLKSPIIYSGNYACVFKLNNKNNNHSWAVRCFLKTTPDYQERYREIHKYLQKTKLPYFLNFELIEKGINIDNKWYPIIKMEWVEGDTLDTFLKNNYLINPQIIENFIEKWITMSETLQQFKIAHGDIQHKNIIISSQKSSYQIKLVDYDGMFIPPLKGKKTSS